MRFSPLYSGSSGNCSVITNGNTTLLIDAGMTGKAIEAALHQVNIEPSEIDAILVTHEHIDHVKAVGILSRRYNLPVYANEKTWRAMDEMVGRIAFCNIRTFITGQNFYIGDMDITPLATSHDAAESVGYRFFYRGASLMYLTDTGCVTDCLRKASEGVNLLFLESNHDVGMLKCGSYPYPLKKRILSDRGHLSNAAAGELLAKLYPTGVKRTILAHLSGENNTEQLAYDTVREILRGDGISDESLFVAVAHRDRVTGVFDI